MLNTLRINWILWAMGLGRVALCLLSPQDTSSVLLSLSDGSSSSNDVELYKRLDMQVLSYMIYICTDCYEIHLQVQVARINLHRIFFESSITDKMAYIAHTRLLREEKAFKKPVTVKVRNTHNSFVKFGFILLRRPSQAGLWFLISHVKLRESYHLLLKNRWSVVSREA